MRSLEPARAGGLSKSFWRAPVNFPTPPPVPPRSPHRRRIFARHRGKLGSALKIALIHHPLAEPSRHSIVARPCRSRLLSSWRQRHKVTNWATYDSALRQRGSLTVWFTEAAIAAWKAEPRGTRGGQPRYSALAITTALTLRAVFRHGCHVQNVAHYPSDCSAQNKRRLPPALPLSSPGRRPKSGRCRGCPVRHRDAACRRPRWRRAHRRTWSQPDTRLPARYGPRRR